MADTLVAASGENEADSAELAYAQVETSSEMEAVRVESANVRVIA